MVDIVVTNLNDSGTGSLRDALAFVAAGNDSNNSISFDFSLAGQVLNLNSRLTWNSGKNLVIDGYADPSANDSENRMVTISGQGTTSILQNLSPVTGSLVLQNMTIANGFADTGFPVAAITNGGQMILNNVQFSGNQAVGVDQPAGTGTSADRATIIFNNGQMALQDVVFDDSNIVQGGDGAGTFASLGGAGGEASLIFNNGFLTGTEIVLAGTVTGGNGGFGAIISGLGGGAHGISSFGTITDLGIDSNNFFNPLTQTAGSGILPGSTNLIGQLAGDVSGITSVADRSGSFGDDILFSTVAVAVGQPGPSIYGFAGDDTYDGLSQNDNVFGGHGRDTLKGNEGNDTLHGGEDNDQLEGGANNDSLFGGAGDDQLIGGNGNDELFGGAGFDVLQGDSGINQLFGGADSDGLIGGFGAQETLDGGEGNDIITLVNAGGNPMKLGSIYRGGTGIDILTFSSAPGNDFDFSGIGAEFDFEAGTYRQSAFAPGQFIEVSSFETIQILIGPDFSIDPAPDPANLGATVLGTADENFFTGSNGSEYFDGRGGNDILAGNGGIDILIGGTGTDTLFGGFGNDDLTGGADGDFLIGGSGRDRAFYTFAPTGVTANIINSALNTGDAAGDTYESIEALYGSVFNDILTSGNDDNDLVGSDGNDTLIGAGGRDRLFGGEDNDRLLGGSGNDDLFGQGGADVFVIRLNDGNDRIFDFTFGEDKIEFSGGVGRFEDLLISQVGANTLISSMNGNTTVLNTTASAFSASNFSFTNPVAQTYDLTTTDDVFFGTSTTDTVNGLAGDDVLRGLAGDDTLNGGNDNDDLFGGLGANTLNGGNGRDRVFYSDATSGVTANFINQLFNQGQAAGDVYISIESIGGSNFADSLTSGNDDNDLIGLNGNDVLIGAGGRDRLFGGADDDRLLGGSGNDDLFGQAGNDTFVFRANAGNDRIFDFEQGSDTLEYRDGVTFGTLAIAQAGTNVTITSSLGVLTVIGDLAGNFDASDFNFL